MLKTKMVLVALLIWLVVVAAPVFAAITKDTVLDRVEILYRGEVQVRMAVELSEDGVVKGRQFRRRVITPGMDYSQAPAKVRTLCAALHTPAVIAAYQDFINGVPDPVTPGLTKDTRYTKIVCNRDQVVTIRVTVTFLENGKIVSKSHNWRKVSPGDDYSDLPLRVRQIITWAQN